VPPERIAPTGALAARPGGAACRRAARRPSTATRAFALLLLVGLSITGRFAPTSIEGLVPVATAASAPQRLESTLRAPERDASEEARPVEAKLPAAAAPLSGEPRHAPDAVSCAHAMATKGGEPARASRKSFGLARSDGRRTHLVLRVLRI
jgi:hypothetical protein